MIAAEIFGITCLRSAESCPVGHCVNGFPELTEEAIARAIKPSEYQTGNRKKRKVSEELIEFIEDR